MCLSNLSESDVKFMMHFLREFDVSVDCIRGRYIFQDDPFIEGLFVKGELQAILSEEIHNATYNHDLLTPAQEFCHAFEEFFETDFWFTDYAKRGEIKLSEIIGTFRYRGRDVIVEKSNLAFGLDVYFKE